MNERPARGASGRCRAGWWPAISPAGQRPSHNKAATLTHLHERPPHASARILSLLVLLALVFACRSRSNPSRRRTRTSPAVEELRSSSSTNSTTRRLPAISIATRGRPENRLGGRVRLSRIARRRSRQRGTVYRVGSVSKLFTDVAVMQLVEEGKDRPRHGRGERTSRISSPAYKDGEKTHHAADADVAPLRTDPRAANRELLRPSASRRSKKRALSLNNIGLIYPPERASSIPTPRLALLGIAVEKSQNEQYAKFVQRRVIDHARDEVEFVHAHSPT